ncbi:hypothetical protein [Maribacter sp. 2210JD10-5]|uniref:hypothetical protein n=1 Tax=Maribacter sp. 2210JD10-5 TaxID=3386272 RepID=UPI0039BC6FA5
MKKYIMMALLAVGMIFSVEAMHISNEKTTLASVTDEFKKVSSKELTPPVVEEILKQYPTSKLAAVYKNNSGEFKLIMVLKSGTRRTVYIDVNGNWLKKK